MLGNRKNSTLWGGIWKVPAATSPKTFAWVNEEGGSTVSLEKSTASLQGPKEEKSTGFSRRNAALTTVADIRPSRSAVTTAS